MTTVLINTPKLEDLFREVLETLQYDVKDPGLIDTPKRMAHAYVEMLDYTDNNIGTTFEAVETDQMVTVSGIEEFSLCEHHLLPFEFTASVGYITHKKVIGLSKIPRIVRKHARKLQLQERLGQDILNELTNIVEPLGVIVVIKGFHTCMRMRGVKSSGSMTTSCMSGVFKHNKASVEEFFNLISIAK